MSIDGLQVGQNLAQQVVAPEARRPDVEREAASTNVASTSEQQSSQDNQDFADNRERSAGNPASLNIETAVAEISEFVQSQNRQLQFSIDESSQRSVVRVTDSDSGEVIRQIPSEEVLALSERIQDLQNDVGAAVGVLFNRQV